MTFRQFLSRYLIYFAPIMYLGYLVAESYQMDFRAFYVAAKSVLHHLDPYLNPVSEWPELFAAGNADANPASGFRYPPLAALLFMPLGLLAYEPSRVLFSLLNFGLFMLTCFYLTRLNGTRMQGTAILFAMVSFPILDERVLNGLKETYNSLGVPVGATVNAIQAMKEVTASLVGADAGKEMGVYFDYICSGLS